MTPTRRHVLSLGLAAASGSLLPLSLHADSVASAWSLLAPDPPALGPETAPVTITEFSDFSCPYSAQGARALRRLLTTSAGQVRWVFRHYPIGTKRDASLPHEAALAARAQGRFWDMHELLFRHHSRHEPDDLLRYAGILHLDLIQFREALNSRTHQGAVLRDAAAGRRLGVFVTPTYFVNRRPVVGARSAVELRALVDSEASRPQ